MPLAEAASFNPGLARATALGFARVLLVGDAPYYGRFGFRRLDGVAMPPPTNPARVLGLELQPGAWVGIGGPVEREARPEVAAGLAEAADAAPSACVEVDPLTEGSR